MKTHAPQKNRPGGAKGGGKAKASHASPAKSPRRSGVVNGTDRDEAAQSPRSAKDGPEPKRLIVSRTFTQRSRLLGRGSWRVASGSVIVAVGGVLMLTAGQGLGAGPIRSAVHLLICAQVMLVGLAWIYLGLAPALATHRVDAKGIVRSFLFLGRRTRWRDVYLMGLGDDIALQAGRAEISLPSSRGFVQRNEKTLLHWWRRAVTGSGARRVPLISRGLHRVGVWLPAASALTLATWLCAGLQGPDSSAGVFLATGLAAAALGCAYVAAWLFVERVTLTCGRLERRDLLARRRLALADVNLIVLHAHELDFTIRWGRVELYADGKCLDFRCAGEAYETLSATIVRSCPRAFVLERHTKQVAPPLADDVADLQDTAAQGARQAGIRSRAIAIAAFGGVLLTGLVALACFQRAMWLGAALCGASCLYWLAGTYTGLARAHRASQAGREIRDFSLEQWEDHSVSPEEDRILDLIA